MCGIAGIINAKGAANGVAHLHSALEALAHRGPEGGVHWVDEAGEVALGHCRLSIIDLTDRARQPFQYAGRYTITYNGELYNYLELKADLVKRGCSFVTDSDTEVVIAAYATHGKDCLRHFDGAFAFALWDSRDQVLFAARDRFGEKPFFFSPKEGSLLFASEMKSLWKLGGAKEVNEALLYNFLTLGYVQNPADGTETFYKGVYKLPAGSFLTYRKGGEVEIETYWQLNIAPNSSIGEADAINHFTHLFSDSVKKRLRSDVAVGTSLSGGLDSAAVVAFCSQQGAGHYSHQSFTAVFPGFEKNEAEAAALVAQKFGLRNHPVTVEPGEVVALMERVMAQQEEPIGSASALAQYRVYEAAKGAGVTVLLDGQGADEVLGGYDKYYKWYWRELYAEGLLGRSGELGSARALGVREPFGLSNKLAALLPQLTASLLQVKKERAAARHPRLSTHFAFANKRNSYYRIPHQMNLAGVLHYNTTANGLEELLRTADRNSMAHAVEVRLPFLSHALVEFLFTLPSHYKIRQGWRKWLLRKAAEPLLPSEVVWQRTKTGFEPPQQMWMEQGAVKEAIQEAKELLVERGILSPSELRRKVRPHEAYAANNWDWKVWSASFLFR